MPPTHTRLEPHARQREGNVADSGAFFRGGTFCKNGNWQVRVFQGLAIVFLQVQSKGKQAGDPQSKLHGTGRFHSHENG